MSFTTENEKFTISLHLVFREEIKHRFLNKIMAEAIKIHNIMGIADSLPLLSFYFDLTRREAKKLQVRKNRTRRFQMKVSAKDLEPNSGSSGLNSLFAWLHID